MRHKVQVTDEAHIPVVAACHEVCFPNSFSTMLGMPYLAKTFEWYLAHKGRALFHIEDGSGMVIGYIGLFVPEEGQVGSSSSLLQFAMPQAISGILKNPSLIFKKELRQFYPLILKNIRSRLFQKNAYRQNNSSNIVGSAMGLVVIGVHPSMRGKGVFEQLMETFEQHAQEINLSLLYLSVKKNNPRAISAYKKMGWHISEDGGDSFGMQKILAITRMAIL